MDLDDEGLFGVFEDEGAKRFQDQQEQEEAEEVANMR
jgi:hypothetical protein